ncbi:MAG: class I SAM-dependent methyltransferase [Microthrixaceae bacterium]
MSDEHPPVRRHPSAGNIHEPPTATSTGGSRRSAAPPTWQWPEGIVFDPSTIQLGPGVTDTAVGRLVGHGAGRRILELGAGDGSRAVLLALQGAKVIVVDPSVEAIAAVRRRAAEYDVKIECHHSDLADLAFVRGDRIDLCLAVYSLARVADVARVFRQAHRVMRSEAPLLLTLPIH